ncbi:tail terminator [Mycobacterium phage Taquito]|uniref:Tail terminator n=2 Tax=Fionnbharthvirus TaxID=2948708 RepID=A0A6G6XSV5_9CAUD|nr:tail terminator [Mycobacterium phage Eponine]YP_009950453.1 tail terminator [Mycobacterium phage Taquito]QTF81625.1 tail terminator [Mycobacterium phage Juliette]USH45296.1 tail terminator [Mycobacterium phage Ruthiejr]AOT23137.1 tail terminator [Mycobacterium phage Taquito]QIG61797.1 tail terminator [Mycobacterium phage Eponine]
MTGPILLPPVGPLVASNTYLHDELAARNNPLPVGITPPGGTPTSYALLSLVNTNTRAFLADYLIRVRVFDGDAVRLENNANLLHRLMLHAVRRLIVTSEGSVRINGTKHHYGPADLDDPDVPLFGKELAVFWTIGLQAESR